MKKYLFILLGLIPLTAFTQIKPSTKLDPVVRNTSGTFTDNRDSKIYKIVTIGKQVWMAQNLAYLPLVYSPSVYSNTAARYYVYRYDGANVAEAKATVDYATYGVLYNYYAAKSACPCGWHLPSDAEWTQLTDFLGGGSTAGGKMKSTGTIEAGTGLWYDPNSDANNKSGFSALPGSARFTNGSTGAVGGIGFWWSSTEKEYAYAYYRKLSYDTSSIFRGSYYEGNGLSIRCVKDN